MLLACGLPCCARNDARDLYIELGFFSVLFDAGNSWTKLTYHSRRSGVSKT
jgi:hypothetical protein